MEAYKISCLQNECHRSILLYGVTLLLMSVAPLANMMVWFNAHHDVHPPTARQLRWELMWRIMRWQIHTCKESIPDSFRSSSSGTLSDEGSYDGPNRQAYFLNTCFTFEKAASGYSASAFLWVNIQQNPAYNFNINKFNIYVSTYFLLLL